MNRNNLLLGLGGVGLLYLLTRRASASPASAQVAQTSNPANVPPLTPITVTTPSMPSLPGINLSPIDVSSALPELPGSIAVTAAQAAQGTSLWDGLSSAPTLVSGWVNFPSGSQAAASLFEVRADAAGNNYVEWSGQVYQLSGPDDSGNYTATLYTG